MLGESLNNNNPGEFTFLPVVNYGCLQAGELIEIIATVETLSTDDPNHQFALELFDFNTMTILAEV